MSHSKLVEQVVSGKSAQHIIDALVEELPPLPMLYQIVRKEMPRGTGVRIEENVVFVKPQTKVLKSKVSERSDYLQLMFPELEFVVEQATEAQTYFGAGLRANDKPPTKVGDRVKVLDGPNKGRLGDVTRFEPDGWYAWVDVEGAGGKLVKYHTKDLRKQ
jgi:transcription antitermination factor NusG